jgi:hypothetical protein
VFNIYLESILLHVSTGMDHVQVVTMSEIKVDYLLYSLIENMGPVFRKLRSFLLRSSLCLSHGKVAKA